MFSWPVLSLEPLEVFVGEIMRVSCVINSYSPERVVIEDMKFSIYRNQQLLARAASYSVVAQPSQNGNYTCRAEADSQGSPLVKESATLLVQAKGETSTFIFND